MSVLSQEMNIHIAYAVLVKSKWINGQMNIDARHFRSSVLKKKMSYCDR